MKLDPKPSKRYAEYLRKVKCDEWEVVGAAASGDKVILRHVKSDTTVAYCTHDGGNDWNGPRNMALEIQRACGCRVIEPRGRKKGRTKVDSETAAIETARAKHHAEYLDRLDHASTQRERERARIERDEHLAELREACEYAASAAREHPQDRRARAHFERLRQQLHEALKGGAS